MTVQAKPAKLGRLGTQFRGKLADAYGQRGGYDSNLWYVYSPRTACDWVLKSDLEWDHFVLAEADPTIKDIDYSPAPLRERLDDGRIYETTLDATIVHTDDSIEWREIKYAEASNKKEETRNRLQQEAQSKAAQRAGVAYTRWTEHEIRSNFQKLANWRRIIVWLAATRERSLAAYQTDIACLLDRRHVVTLGEIEDQWGEPAFPLYAAALFRCLQQDSYLSDLDIKPLSRLTRISVPGEKI
jgi:hypothetical protein